MEPLARQLVPQGLRPEASEAPEHRCEGGAGEPGAGPGAGKGVSTPGSTTPWGLSPLLSGHQEEPGRAMLGGALGPQPLSPKTRKCQR